ncbi:MAG: GspH/FimT family pseudopilin [Nitrospinae bacterium]|nr:GspH/FimT family pseudopilin [Nitrospinota bacterium]MBL7020311.1 GspH/FimT family pseudopilin [Nitrospinaceae bacterium]
MLSTKGLKGLKHLLKSREGFTLIETVMVLAVLGVIMATAAPNFSKWKEKHQINGQAQKIYFDLMLARTTAVRNNNIVRVTFNTTNNTYTIHDDTDSDGTKGAGEAVKSGALENDINFAFNSGISDIDGNAVSAAVSFGGSQTVTFDSRGQSSASGSVFLLHTTDIDNTNDRARHISVLQATGAVDYWTYDGSVTPPWK